ncbi:sulfurtransferase TusA family protein [Bacillaceae bacterium]
MKVDQTVDARSLSCPMPVVKAKKAIDAMEPGQVLEVLTTDKGSVKDIPSWVKQANHELIKQVEEDGVYKFYVRKA